MTNKYSVIGLDCPNCAKKLSSMVEKIEGVSAVKLNFLTEVMTVESDLDAATLDTAVIAAGKAFSSKVSISRL